MQLIHVRAQVERELAQPMPMPERPPEELLTPTQRRIWRDEARQRATAEGLRERLRRALEDYDPIVPPELWFSGAAEHACPWWRHVNPFVAGTIVVAAWIISIALLTALSLDAGLSIPIAAVALLGAIGFFDVAHPTESCRWYNGIMPTHALRAYREAKASRLFDRIEVYSPRPWDFSEHQPRTNIDPLLVGHIGRYAFLLAYWNLAEDLQLVQPDVRMANR